MPQPMDKADLFDEMYALVMKLSARECECGKEALALIRKASGDAGEEATEEAAAYAAWLKQREAAMQSRVIPDPSNQAG